MLRGYRIGLTGASGMLGSILRPHFESLGATVFGIDKSIPQSQGAPKLNFVLNDIVDRICDFSDASSCEHVFDDCTHVVHLAAQGNPDALMSEDILPNNVVGMINATNAAKKAGTVQRFVFASTNHIYHGNTMGSNGPGSFSLARANAMGGPGATTIVSCSPFPFSSCSPSFFSSLSLPTQLLSSSNCYCCFFIFLFSGYFFLQIRHIHSHPIQIMP